MPGPSPQDRKHGRTPNSLSSGEWREIDDIPFTGAPPMPQPTGRRKTWHLMAVRLWETSSVMPHCKDWRAEDWLALEVLMHEVHRYYASGDDAKTTAQQTEIRRQKNALGIGDQGRREQKILYKQRVEPGLPGNGPDGAQQVVDLSVTRAAGEVVSLSGRRKAIADRNKADSATG